MGKENVFPDHVVIVFDDEEGKTTMALVNEYQQHRGDPGIEWGGHTHGTSYVQFGTGFDVELVAEFVAELKRRGIREGAIQVLHNQEHVIEGG